MRTISAANGNGGLGAFSDGCAEVAGIAFRRAIRYFAFAVSIGHVTAQRDGVQRTGICPGTKRNGIIGAVINRSVASIVNIITDCLRDCSGLVA